MRRLDLRRGLIAAGIMLVFVSTASPVRGQADTVTVTASTASVYARPSTGSDVVARVRAGAQLDVIGKENDWYKVTVPREARLSPSGPASGYIQAKLVGLAPRRGTSQAGGRRPGAPVARAGRGAQGWTAWHIRPLAEVAVQSFTASGTFKGVFGSSLGVFYGGGVDMAFYRNLFAQVTVTHFQKSGQRAYVYNGQAYQLGIADDVSITPIAVSIGYRFLNVKRVTPYVAGGVGAVQYSETAAFAQPGENVNKTGTAYQVIAGVELPLSRHLSLGVEGQFQSVRNVLGAGGISQALNEPDLGGTSVRVKILFGK